MPALGGRTEFLGWSTCVLIHYVRPQMELWAPDFGFLQSWLLWETGEFNTIKENSVSLWQSVSQEMRLEKPENQMHIYEGKCDHHSTQTVLHSVYIVSAVEGALLCSFYNLSHTLVQSLALLLTTWNFFKWQLNFISRFFTPKIFIPILLLFFLENTFNFMK